MLSVLVHLIDGIENLFPPPPCLPFTLCTLPALLLLFLLHLTPPHSLHPPLSTLPLPPPLVSPSLSAPSPLYPPSPVLPSVHKQHVQDASTTVLLREELNLATEEIIRATTLGGLKWTPRYGAT